MPKQLIALAAAAVALPLLLSGCAQEPATPDPTDAASSANEQLSELQRAGKVPASFPANPTVLRVETAGDEFGIYWKGEPMTEDCAPGDATPNSTASSMLLQDVGIDDVQQCGTIWQAKQVDGSYIAWNAKA